MTTITPTLAQRAARCNNLAAREAMNFLASKPTEAIAALKKLNVYSIYELDIYWVLCKEQPRAADVVFMIARKEGLA